MAAVAESSRLVALRDAGASSGGALAQGLLVALALAPLAVRYSVSAPAWDELFFLYSAVCVNDAVFSASLNAFDACLAGMNKSPIMAGLLLPAGPLQGSLSKVAAAPVVLALLTFSQIILLAVLLRRLRVPGFAVAIAALSILLTPALTAGGAPFLVDNLLAVITLNTLLLLPLELDEPTSGTRAAIGRGLLWGTIGLLGLLSKLTYLMFAALIFLPVIIVSLRRGGLTQTVMKTGAALAFAAIASVVLVRYGPAFYRHAAASAFGELSQYYSDGLTRFAFLYESARAVWPIWIAVAALAAWALWRGRRSPRHLVVAGYLLGILALYVVVASGSVNRDARFFLPVWLALPFCAAVAISPFRSARPLAPATLCPLVAVALVLCFPMLGRFDFSAVAHAARVLELLPSDRPITVIIGTDEGLFNVETLTLAQRVGGAIHSNKTIRTVVYDIVHNRTVEQSIETLRKADYVIMRNPLPRPDPEWTNRFRQQFLEALKASNDVLETLPGTPQTIVFRRRAP